MVIKSIDRLGRNYDEIIEQWRYLIKEKEIDIKVCDFALLNTKTTDDTNVTGKFISDLVLQILSYVAQVERENLLQRQKEGIKEARKKGVKFGRPRKRKPINFDEIFQLWNSKKITVQEAAKRLNIPKTTCYNWLKKAKKE